MATASLTLLARPEASRYATMSAAVVVLAYRVNASPAAACSLMGTFFERASATEPSCCGGSGPLDSAAAAIRSVQWKVQGGGPEGTP